MNERPGSKGPRRPDGGGRGQASRDDRLKAALKANMARRKAQIRARDGGAKDEANSDPDPAGDGQQQDG